MADFDDDDLYISWLTQVPRNENISMDVGEDSGIFSANDVSNLVSLEEGPDVQDKHVLYDNVICEDISSDEELEKL